MRFGIPVGALCALLVAAAQAGASTIGINADGLFMSGFGLQNINGELFLTDSQSASGVADGTGQPYSESVGATASIIPEGNLLFVGHLYLEATGAGSVIAGTGGTVNGTLSGQTPGCLNSSGQFIQGYPVRFQWTTDGVIDAATASVTMFGSTPDFFSFQTQFVANDPTTWSVQHDACLGGNAYASAGLSITQVTGGVADFANTFTTRMILPEGVTFTADTGQVITAGNSLAAVPEPASLTLLGFGLAGMGARRWWQRKA